MPDPEAGGGEVVVQVLATCVAPYAAEVFSGERNYPLVPPVVPGIGGVARVVHVGPDATRLRPGDLVWCDSTVRSRDDALTPDITLQGWSSRGEGGAHAAQAVCVALDRAVSWPSRLLTDGYADFLADDLLPWAAMRWSAAADPRRTVVAGQNLGGTAALHTCLRRPERFGSALAQSPRTRPTAGSDRPPALRAPSTTSRPGRCSGSPRTIGAASVCTSTSPGRTSWRPPAARSMTACAAVGTSSPGRSSTAVATHDDACWRGGLADGLISLLGG
ncbi:alpha/beta hydrolase-fold protein [Streptomyces sp. NPDC048650]|uniref:alpha/beta hydrolase-fold protein n=1 Tax=Streptomyces sp. NPDC048650 TaxID=3365583 RepID=UPI003724AD6F